MAIIVLLVVAAPLFIWSMIWEHYDYLALKQRLQLYDEFDVVFAPDSVWDEWRKTVKYCDAIERVSRADHRRALMRGQNWRALYEAEFRKEGLVP